jgi:hypothetical protein
MDCFWFVSASVGISVSKLLSHHRHTSTVREIVDVVVSANILSCFYYFDRGSQFSCTIKHVHDVLLHRAYLDGTRYYLSADCCLGFFGRLLRFAKKDALLQSTLGPLLRSRLEERVGEKGSALDLAMRILACDILGVECNIDRKVLLRLQCEDGSWEPGWMYQYGTTKIKLGNRCVTTALAIAAITSSAGVSSAVIDKD